MPGRDRSLKTGSLLVSGIWTEGGAPSEMGNPRGGTGLHGRKNEFPSGHFKSDMPVGGTSGSSPMGRHLLRCSGKRSRHTGSIISSVSQLWLSWIDLIVKLKLLPAQEL